MARCLKRANGFAADAAHAFAKAGKAMERACIAAGHEFKASAKPADESDEPSKPAPKRGSKPGAAGAVDGVPLPA